MKYRVGKNQHRAILETKTGKEYLIFPVGSERACIEYCNYLNNPFVRFIKFIKKFKPHRINKQSK